MSSRNPPTLCELAIQSMLQDEATTIACLDWLPTALFPPLFKAAVAGGHSGIVKAMVASWPFIRLPLGALMKPGSSHQSTLKAALDGLDNLLSQKVQPRRCKLMALDLRLDTVTNFWNVFGTQSSTSEPSLQTPTTPQSWSKAQEGDHSGSVEKHQSLGRLEVLTDLCFQEAFPDKLLTFLIERVMERKGLPHLRCRKLQFIGTTSLLPVFGDILNMVQLDAVQEVEMHCSWDLHSLNLFAPHLAQMVHLNTLHLSGIFLNCAMFCQENEVANLLAQFTSPFLGLHHLQHLILDSVFLKNCLHKLLGCLQTPLETLRISHCSLVASDSTCLSLCACTSQLRSLGLSDVFRGGVSHAFLPGLLRRVSATLTHLHLAACGITDSELRALQPALGLCSQLSTLVLCGNSVSMAALQALLQHTIPLCKFTLLELPVPLHCYVGSQSSLLWGSLVYVIEDLKLTLQPLRPCSVIFSPKHDSSSWDTIIIHLYS
ncbi:melanoma antigen preferentially expressed in tumors-like [Echinops telfairi]|uniref:Melanoma antigen preferentially expressed in tumors-like n=1 Tax=Echinops telfairi TaxID=9371 RepID=A0AC55D2W4_ECHTE|nr:melanoma antigen preferentially expressed in tumors-like [Echinops telfairi]